MGYPFYIPEDGPNLHLWVYWVRVSFIRPHELFDMIGHVVADDGAALRDIYANTGASVRVCGRGTQLLEMPLDRSLVEEQIPLKLVMGAVVRDPALFRAAADRLVRHLEAVAERYQEWCETNGLPVLGPGQHIFWIDEPSLSCQELVADLRIRYPAPPLARFSDSP